MILFFVKTPQSGQVKSRLSPFLGDANVLELYRGFVCDMLDTLDNTGLPCTICFHPPDAGAAISAWLGASRSYRQQQGTDVGQRMEQAFRSTFSAGCERAVLIGSDIPDLPASILTDALDALRSKDAVIGPASDGGYYLIGFRRSSFLPEVFHGIAWSRPDVFRRTMQAFALKKRAVHVLPSWQDVDTAEDLLALIKRNRSTAFAKSRTMSFLRTMKNGIPGLEDLYGTV